MDERSLKANQVTLLGLFINILLAGFKIFAGIVGRSAAIFADAFHSLSDLSTDIALLWGFKEASKPIDKCHDYGHGKIETLISVLIGIVLLFVGIKIFWQGSWKIVKVYRGEILSAPGWIAFYAAVVSIISKEWIYRRTIDVGEAIHSEAIIANAWHHRTDALSSVGVMIGIAGAILLGESWRILDPLAAIIVSFFIVKAALRILTKNANELLDASLGEETEKEILKIIQAVSGAGHPHSLRTRKIGGNIAVEIHIRVDPALDVRQAHDISTNVEQTIKKKFGSGTFVSVHVEPLK